MKVITITQIIQDFKTIVNRLFMYFTLSFIVIFISKTILKILKVKVIGYSKIINIQLLISIVKQVFIPIVNAITILYNEIGYNNCFVYIYCSCLPLDMKDVQYLDSKQIVPLCTLMDYKGAFFSWMYDVLNGTTDKAIVFHI